MEMGQNAFCKGFTREKIFFKYHLKIEPRTEECVRGRQLSVGTVRETEISIADRKKFRDIFPLVPPCKFHGNGTIRHFVKDLHVWLRTPRWGRYMFSRCAQQMVWYSPRSVREYSARSRDAPRWILGEFEVKNFKKNFFTRKS